MSEETPNEELPPNNVQDVIDHKDFGLHASLIGVAHLKQLIREVLQENKKTDKFPKTREELALCLEKDLSTISRATSKTIKYPTALRLAIALKVDVDVLTPSVLDWLCNVYKRLNPSKDNQTIFSEVKAFLDV